MGVSQKKTIKTKTQIKPKNKIKQNANKCNVIYEM